MCADNISHIITRLDFCVMMNSLRCLKKQRCTFTITSQFVHIEWFYCYHFHITHIHIYIYIFFFTHTNNSKCLPYIHETLYFVHFKDFTYLLPIANSEFTDNLICMYFDCGRKSKYPGEKMQTPHRKAIARVQTVQLLKAQNLHNTHFCNRWTQYNSILHLYDQNYMYLSK